MRSVVGRGQPVISHNGELHDNYILPTLQQELIPLIIREIHEDRR